MMNFKILFPLTILSSTLASSKGARICDISADSIAGGMSAKESDLGYKITLDKSIQLNSDAPISIKLSGVDKYKGIILYVTNEEETEKYGKFKATTGFKDCAANCKGKAPDGSMLTHTSKEYKDANQSFEWTPPKLTECKKLKVRASIVKEMESFQVLKDVPINCEGAKPSPSQASSEASIALPSSASPSSVIGSTNSTSTPTSIPEESNKSSVAAPSDTTTTKQRCVKKYSY